MSVFNRDDNAWSAWTKSIEDFAGNPGSPLIVQSPTILRPLKARTGVDPALAWFRKLIIGDSVPAYGKANPLSYVNATDKSVGNGYKQYLGALNSEAYKRYLNPNEQAKIDTALTSYLTAQKALTSFQRAANADWRKNKAADPTLTRGEWDKDYGNMGYTPQLTILTDDSHTKYGQWKALSAPYPELKRIADALAIMDNDSSSTILLPSSDEAAQIGKDAYDRFYKTNIDLGITWDDFWSNETSMDLGIQQSSMLSTSYEHRWSAGGSVGYGFFNVGGSASGGNIENHLRAGTQSLKFSFKRLTLGTITRGNWYDGGLVTSPPYYTWVDRNEYWGVNGTLSLIPVSVIIGRGLSVTISTSQHAYDEYQNWYNQSASAGFSFGPWSVGGGESSSTSSTTISNTSSGTSITINDTSGDAYLIGVISRKMDDLTSSTVQYREIAETEMENFRLQQLAWDNSFGII
jgi:hypothetical protein